MIDEIVKYCHEQYQNKPLFCENCDELFCTKGCKQCLKDIHFDPNCHRNYDCSNMCYYYVCQDMYKYATEMVYLWHDLITRFVGKDKLFPALDICSIGCGPCSELIALEEYYFKKGISVPFNFVGFEIESTWKELQDFIKAKSSFSNSIVFESTDVFQYYETHDKPNVIVLNYMLSNMLKNNSNDFKPFLNSLYSLFTDIPKGVLLINDINIGKYDTQVRYYYDAIIESLRHTNKIQVGCFHFKDTLNNYYVYGEQRAKSELLFQVPEIISSTFDTNTECHSAQLLIVKG